MDFRRVVDSLWPSTDTCKQISRDRHDSIARSLGQSPIVSCGSPLVVHNFGEELEADLARADSNGRTDGYDGIEMRTIVFPHTNTHPDAQPGGSQYE